MAKSNGRKRRRRAPQPGNITIDLGESVERQLALLLGPMKSVRSSLRWYRKVERMTEAERERLDREVEALIEARDAVCDRCRKGEEPHGCPAFLIRRMIADRDPERADLSPKDWSPAPPGKS